MDYTQAMAVLADVFHIIPKEILDLENPDLLPGELGIHYVTGSMFFCNPRTGLTVSPNKADAMLQFVGAKYNFTLDELNSELWGGIRMYSELSELNIPEGTETIELIFAAMKDKSTLLTVIPSGTLNGILPNDRGGFLLIRKNVDEMQMDFSDRLNFKFSAFYDVKGAPELKPWSSGGGGSGEIILEATGVDSYTATSDAITAYRENLTVDVFITQTNTHAPSLNINSLGDIPIGTLDLTGTFVPTKPLQMKAYQYTKLRMKNNKLIVVSSGSGSGGGVHLSELEPDDQTLSWLYDLGNDSLVDTLIIANASLTNPDAEVTTEDVTPLE